MSEKSRNQEEVHASNEEKENIEDTMQEVQDSMEEESIEKEGAEDCVDLESEKKEEKGKSSKSIFRKEKKEKKDPKDEKIEELSDRLMRSMAEFDNFRKRSEKEKSMMFEMGAKDIVEKILPVIDNFERGLSSLTEEEKTNAFVQGIEKIYKQFLSALEDAGVTAIEAVGKEFDPNYHNAVMHAEDENQGENIITDEFQKGYLYKDSVVRHSMVKVVN